LEVLVFLNIPILYPGKFLLRQNYSRPRSFNPPKAEVFPARKSLISDIPGFQAGDRDHLLTFLTVNEEGRIQIRKTISMIHDKNYH
jgi:hypothetical protein